MLYKQKNIGVMPNKWLTKIKTNTKAKVVGKDKTDKKNILK